MSQPYVSYTVQNQIGTIEFYTPQHNSLPASILQQLAKTITNAGLDDDCKVIILKCWQQNILCWC